MMIQKRGRQNDAGAILHYRIIFLSRVMLLLPFATAFGGICVQHGRTSSLLLLSSRRIPNDDDDCIGVGIDLGTTNSAIAFLDDNNKPRIIEIPNNGRTVKSVVAFEDTDSGDDFSTALVGNDALQWERRNLETAYRHVKRVIGLGSTFLPKETREVVPHLVPWIDDGVKEKKKSKFKKSKNKAPTLLKLLEDAKENPAMLYSLYGKGDRPQISPETISSCILQKLLHIAADHTGKTITRAVIGVPAYFNDEQREATIRAAKACGVEKVKLLREPEAAALAYGVGKDSSGGNEELVLVFDLGGGTYDVSILLIEKGLTEIVCTSGNAQLGGTNFDAKIAQYLSKLIGVRLVSESSNDMLLRAAESIRIYLSNNRVANLALPITEMGWIELTDVNSVMVPLPSKEEKMDDGTVIDNQNSTHVYCQLTRKEMESLCVDEFQGLIRPIREVAIMAGALLPGDARPGIVESALEIESTYSETQQFYDSDDDTSTSANDDYDDDPESDASSGDDDLRSAKKLQQKGRKKAREVAKEERKYRAESRKVQDVQDTKIRTDGISGRPISRVVLVGGATRMPTIGRIISSLTGIVPQKTVDPDEAVALGCAVHVGVLDGKDEMGVVLNPMQAALLRAVVDKARREGKLDDMSLTDEDEFQDEFENEFTNVEIY
jgi:molecular chaperone DnaK (HSP70)